MTTPRQFLVLGGTAWLGGLVASTARDRGYAVTCLARGESGHVPDGVRHVSADRWRDDAYDRVAEQDWDVVVDVSWQPGLVRSALTALAPRAAHWVYVSSISVYADTATAGQDESGELLTPWAGSGEAPLEAYGPAKVSCETACRDALAPDRLLVARAGLIAGYGDTSDRFGYWPTRFARAEAAERTVLTPSGDSPIQVIDVEDLARWLVDAATAGTSGTYDAVGEALTFETLSRACRFLAGPNAIVAEVDDTWLMEHDVAPWMGPDSLPVWLPRKEYAGMLWRSNQAAVRAGLEPRPLIETVRATLRWERELGLERDRLAGLTPRRERELLVALDGRPAV